MNQHYIYVDISVVSLVCRQDFHCLGHQRRLKPFPLSIGDLTTFDLYPCAVVGWNWRNLPVTFEIGVNNFTGLISKLGLKKKCKVSSNVRNKLILKSVE